MKLTVLHWIIAGLLVVIVFLILSRPEPFDLEGKAYQDSLKVLQQQKAVIQSRQNDLVLGYKIRVKQDSVQLARQDYRIQALQNKATTQRTVVETIIQNNPALESFIGTQNEIIHELQVEVDTLKSSLAFQEQLNADLIQSDYVEDKIEFQMQLDCGKRISDLEKQSRRKSRGNKLLKVAAVVGVVGSFFLGAQL